MLALIILGKDSVTSRNVDVYLQPFIEKLQVLWNGVQTFDLFSKENFNLRAMCIWSVHDFLAYKLFIGCVTKGHVGCPPCGPTIDSCSSKKLKKMIFLGIIATCLEATHIDVTKMFSMGKQKPGSTYSNIYNKHY
jgi:hypothetical protein